MCGESSKYKENKHVELHVQDSEQIQLQQNAYDHYRENFGTNPAPEDSPQPLVQVPRAAKKKHSGKTAPLRRMTETTRERDLGAGTGDPAAPQQQQQVQQTHTAWVDLTAEQRKTKSVKINEKFLGDVGNMVQEDKQSEQFGAYSAQTKELISFAEQMQSPGLKASEKRKNEKEFVTRIRQFMMDPGKFANLPEAEQALWNKYMKKYEPLINGNTGLDQQLKEELNSGKNNDALVDFSQKDDFYKVKENLDKEDWIKEDGNTYTSREVVMKDYKDTPLFSHEPNTFDIMQGNIGDCYMLSGLVAIMQQDPDFIKNCMKDEGDTVLVRFHTMEGKPKFVRVSKTLPERVYHGTDSAGNAVQSESQNYGARNTFWVKIFEKAFAAVREDLEDWKTKLAKATDEDEKDYYEEKIKCQGMSKISGGKQHIFIKLLKGTDMSYQELGGAMELNRVSTKTLIDDMHYDMKKTFAEQRKKEGVWYEKLGIFSRKRWNLFKAKKFFGVDLDKSEGAAYEAFRKNTYFKAYEKFMKDQMKRFSKDSFATSVDADYFIENISYTDMPDLKIEGLNEEAMKKHFLNYFRNYLKSTPKLKSSVNRDDAYTFADGPRVFKDMQDAIKAGKMVTAGSGDLTFSKKKGDGFNGEKTVFGLASGHAYTVLDVSEEKVEVNGKMIDRRFVVLHNPWDEVVRMYDKDTGLPYLAQKKDSTGEDDNHGIFKMEWRDFITNFRSFHLEGGFSND